LNHYNIKRSLNNLSLELASDPINLVGKLILHVFKPSGGHQRGCIVLGILFRALKFHKSTPRSVSRILRTPAIVWPSLTAWHGIFWSSS